MTNRPPDSICPDCGTSVTPFKLPFDDNWRSGSCPSCAERARKETERRDVIAGIDAQIAGINDVLMQRGVARRHVHATIGDFGPDYRTLHAGDKGAFVYGPCGTGKTHLLVAIMRTMILDHLQAARRDEKRPHPLKYPFMVSSTDLLREIRATFSGKKWDDAHTEFDIVERYATLPILMIDDLGAEQITDWSLPVLYSIVDRRYRDVRLTFVTSNLSLKDLSVKASDRLASRLAELCRVVQCGGTDRRLRK